MHVSVSGAAVQHNRRTILGIVPEVERSAAAIMDYCTDQNAVKILCNLLKAQYAKPLMLDFLIESTPMIVWTRQREMLISETGMAEQKLDETLTILWKSMDWVIPTPEPQPDNELERYRRKAEQGDPAAQYQFSAVLLKRKRHKPG